MLHLIVHKQPLFKIKQGYIYFFILYNGVTDGTIQAFPFSTFTNLV
jgi:hypothetical protein